MRPVPQVVLDLIHEFEQGPNGGFASRRYPDPAAVSTIGWGHRIIPGEQFPEPISEADADALAMADLTRSADWIYTQLGDEVVTALRDKQYAALIDFTYNLGVNAFVNSTLCKLVKQGEAREIIAPEFDRWVKSGGQVLQGLVRRRAAEKAFWLA